MSKREHEIWDVEGHAEYLARCWGEAGHERGRHWELLLSVVQLVRTDSMLDMGCGMGHLYAILKKHKPDVSYSGRDNSVEMLKKAWEFYPDEKEKFAIADIYDLDEVPTFPTVTCVDVLMHLPEIETPIRELWKKTEKELIIVSRTSPKPFCIKKPYSGGTQLAEGKMLILRGDNHKTFFNIFADLEDLGTLEVFHYDARSSIFRLTKGRRRYGRFKWAQ